jgi:hypothetical protein
MVMLAGYRKRKDLSAEGVMDFKATGAIYQYEAETSAKK